MKKKKQKNEDNLKNEDKPKRGDNPKNEDNPRSKDDFKNVDDLKNKDSSMLQGFPYGFLCGRVDKYGMGCGGGEVV